MTETQYNDKLFKSRSFNLKLIADGTEEELTIATEALWDELTDNGRISVGKLPKTAENIDNDIHYYVTDEEFEMEAKELCTLLFEEHEFISEVL